MPSATQRRSIQVIKFAPRNKNSPMKRVSILFFCLVAFTVARAQQTISILDNGPITISCGEGSD